MRTRSWLAICAMLVGGCFEEGGDTTREAAVSTLVQGMIAFGDIHSNLETDPGAAGAALLEFVKWPVAADTLVSPPFAGAAEVMDASPRLAPVPLSPVPACLNSSGEPACDNYTTNDTCEAGAFTFRGSMMRRCAKCDEPAGFCAYAWVLPELNFVTEKYTLNMNTAGTWSGATGQITPNLSARYDLNVIAGHRGNRHGNMTACACTVFTVVDSPTETRKPRKLVNSSFVVRATPTNSPERCALVMFDGNGNVSIDDNCVCPGGETCVAPDPQLEVDFNCGNSRCEANIGETYQNCPVDCPFIGAVCPNARCEIGENIETCFEDCKQVMP